MSGTQPEVIQGTASAFDPYQVLNLGWWFQHLSDAYQENPGHTIVEFICICIILWLLLKTPKEKDKLTKKERKALIREWDPEPLVPENIATLPPPHRVVITEREGTKAKVDGKECVNFTSYDYLNFTSDQRLKDASKEIIKSYGVGSCGPRGFYGSMDVHLDLEKAIPIYFETEEEMKSIIYADSIALAPSVITAFAKRGDLIIMDEGCHYLIQKGAMLARSNVIKFKHNDIEDLENILKGIEQKDQESNAPLNRRFLIVEGVYQNYGDICDLTSICLLKNRYRYRLMLDDSHGLGTISPRGSPEAFSVPWGDIDIYFANMDTVLGSTGGFSMAAPKIISHQVLSGSGYVFSASSPPFQVKAAQKVLEFLAEDTKVHRDTKNGLVSKLQVNANYFREQIQEKFKAAGISKDMTMAKKRRDHIQAPLIHLRVPESSLGSPDDPKMATRIFMDGVVKQCLEKGYLLATSYKHLQEDYDVNTSLRLSVSVAHTKAELEQCAVLIADAWSALLKGRSEVTSTETLKN